MDQDTKNGSPGRPGVEPCVEFVERMYLYVSGELERDEQTTMKAHAEECAACTAFLADCERMESALESAPWQEPDASLIAECRANLTDVLDDADAAKGRGVVGQWLDALEPSRWLTLHPAAAAALLLLIGFSAGTFSPRWIASKVAPVIPGAISGATGNDGNASRLTSESSVIPLGDPDFRNADVTGITQVSDSGDAPPQIEVQLNSQRPMLVHGTVADDRVKRLLLYVLGDDQRFDPDVRIESVDLLRPRTHDADVCQALCQLVHTDRNPAVRLKALEALNAEAGDASVRKTMLDALVHDSNPGVRIEAINSLRELADKGKVPADAHLLDVLRERAEKDPSTYIRLQSAATIQDLNPSAKF
jgi:anti-sigma factor RsiW